MDETLYRCFLRLTSLALFSDKHLDLKCHFVQQLRMVQIRNKNKEWIPCETWTHYPCKYVNKFDLFRFTWTWSSDFFEGALKKQQKY